VCRRVVMLMLPYVGGELRVDNPAERHEPEREPYDDDVPNATSHTSLPLSRCFHRLLFLNPCDDFIDLLFGEQATFDVFLHAAFLVDEDAHG
jgi:hypothetical protein